MCASKTSPLTLETAVNRSRPPPILETAIYAPDLDAAEAFYGTLLGLERVTRAGNRHVFFRLERSMLLIFNPGIGVARQLDGDEDTTVYIALDFRL